ncbi:MAG: hypothetical protein GYA55_10525 [SAR324 cluster bacterium]|uniref:Uncharacterized protein n=1 Tax=SAR324 cluster bacterium TaxID=2024889 RepID=A0A7X9FSZ5_9DELT|nr:hypothetical protein [SAR324 cluster bacterium]
MKKLSLSFLFVIWCVTGFFMPSSDAQVPFTVQLGGEGARLGRVNVWQFLPDVGHPVLLECPFALTSGQSVYPLLSNEELSCTFTVAPNTWVSVEAPKDELQASDRNWSVKFSEFSGRCTGQGLFIEASNMYACEGNISESENNNFVVNFVSVSGNPELPTPTPTPTSTATPSATPTIVQHGAVQEYLNSESQYMKKVLLKFNLKNFAKGKGVKLGLAPAPASGQLSVQLKVRIKKYFRILKSERAFAAGVVRNPFSFLVIASGKVPLSQGSPANLLLRPTEKGKTYMKDKKKISATLATNFVPSGGGTSVSQIQSILMRFR